MRRTTSSNVNVSGPTASMILLSSAWPASTHRRAPALKVRGRSEERSRVADRLGERAATVLEADPVGVVERACAREAAHELVGVVERVSRHLYGAAEWVVAIRVARQCADAAALREQHPRDVAARVPERAGDDVELGA